LNLDVHHQKGFSMSHSLRVVIAGCLVVVPACVDTGEEVPTDISVESGAVQEPPGGFPSCVKRSDGRYTCSNRVPAAIVNRSDRRIDMLRTNPSWFVCRTEANASGGGPHPTRWVYTQGDDAGAWGWVRDIDIASETNPLPTCRGNAVKGGPIPTPPPGQR
jgi:hypothetical protein